MTSWLRVSRAEPCKVCGHVDWCTINQSIGMVCCMRVESSRPSKNAMGGWLHSIGMTTAVVKLVQRKEAPPLIGAQAMILKWAESTTETMLQELAASLGVSEDSLADLNAVWAAPHRAWAFPMHDGYGEVVGIRLRAIDGRKWAVRGSRQGVFYPFQFGNVSTCYITEGPTDTAAALTLGLYAIGRPSCCCGGEQIKTLLRSHGVRRAVLVADNDKPGLDGARKVAAQIRLPWCIWIPPCKDLREFVSAGGSRSLIEGSIKDTKWHTG